MNNWEIFESNCTQYLNQNYGNERIRFIQLGKSDSTTADISVEIDGIQIFLIEVKMPKAQSGQFVVLFDENKFIFSPRNKTKEDDYTMFIINHINENINEYNNVGTTSLKINISSSYFSDWIKKYYQSKNVKYIITKHLNDFIIFPLEKYDYYFNVNGNIRLKSSGSNNLPNSYIEDMKKYLEKSIGDDFEIKKEGKKTILETPIDFPDSKIDISDITVYIKKVSDYHIINKLGKTKNPTIVFSIQLTKTQTIDDLNDFEASLLLK
ncbi:MAG: hypothetical protein ACRCZ2_09370 [Fusobacteriaceae bacterium]